MKYCNKCTSHKPLDQFTKDKQKKDGLMSVCRSCNYAKTRAYVESNPEKAKAYFAERNQKIRESKPPREKLSPWRERNPEKYKELMFNHYSKNREILREQQREYYLANKDKFTSYSRKRRELGGEDYKSKRAMCTARRRARIQAAIPIWFDAAKCDAIYQDAAKMTAETGVRHEVDHIVPVRSKLVCGLHWHGNMRIMTKEENAAKGNRHWPDMP